MINQSAIERFVVRITHEPTGITVTRTGQFFRTEREAHGSAMRYIRSRLAMLGYAPSLLRIEHFDPSDPKQEAVNNEQ